MLRNTQRPRSLLVRGGAVAIAAIAGAAFGPLVALALGVVESVDLSTFLVALGPSFAGASLAVLVSSLGSGRTDTPQTKKFAERYELECRLGRGGMGEVWLAKHRLLDRRVAAKFIRPDAIGLDVEDRAITFRRFEREARATASLSSPHTVAIFDFGVGEDGAFYYVMELLDGHDLESLVQTFGPLVAPRVAHLARQICLALAEAHEHGLVHRDVKPANIYVCRLGTERDFVKVLDFGLVTSAEDAREKFTRLTTEGLIAGSPAYMAPEVAKGMRADARSDVYSVGCVVYWMLTARLPFDARSPVEMLAAHAMLPPVSPSDRLGAPIDPELEAIVLLCLAKDPMARPESSAVLARQFEAVSVRLPWRSEDREAWWAEHGRTIGR